MSYTETTLDTSESHAVELHYSDSSSNNIQVSWDATPLSSEDRDALVVTLANALSTLTFLSNTGVVVINTTVDLIRVTED